MFLERGVVYQHVETPQLLRGAIYSFLAEFWISNVATRS